MDAVTAAWVSAIAAVFSIFFMWLSIRASTEARKSAEKIAKDRLEIEKGWRREDRELEEKKAREQRIDRVVDACQGTGILDLIKARATTLSSDSEAREAAELCAAKMGKHPFGGYAPLLEGLDSLEILREWATEKDKQGSDFTKFLQEKRKTAGLPSVSR